MTDTAGIEVQLNDVAVAFVSRQLRASGGALSAEILREVNLPRGVVCSWVPSGLTSPSLEQLDMGTADPQFSQSARTWLLRHLLGLLRARPNAVLLFEDRISDIADWRPDLQVAMAEADQSVLHWLIGAPRLEQENIATVLYRAADWMTVGAIVEAEGLRTELTSRRVTSSALRGALLSCRAVFTSAFDGEGYVIWTPHVLSIND